MQPRFILALALGLTVTGGPFSTLAAVDEPTLRVVVKPPRTEVRVKEFAGSLQGFRVTSQEQGAENLMRLGVELTTPRAKPLLRVQKPTLIQLLE